MSERILAAVAWPYANGSIHIGQVAGCYLPADIFARYHRMKGNEVLMVSGADAHGTPVTLTAEERGESPEQAALREVREEAGVVAEIVERAGEVDFDSDGERARVVYYVMRYVSSTSPAETREKHRCLDC